jgi:hypothetical protein
MKVQKTNDPLKSSGILAVLLLAAILTVLFWRSLLPDYVHFSNDGPLGQQHSAWSRLPNAFWGMWAENNDIGDGGGAWSVSISALFRWAVGPVGYAKFLVPFTLFILGLGAWSFFRQLKLSPLAALLGAMAAALNSTFFATACWGVAPQEIAIGMDYFALALVVSISAETPFFVRLARLAMAGLCVGMNVIEAADIGAIFSLFVSAFVVVNALNQEKGGSLAKVGSGIGRVAVVAVFAGFIACQTVFSLVGTQIQGIAGTGQDTESKAEHWNWATEWSLPKTETLALFVPGLFGYKMDTPANMAPEFAGYYLGGNYWGGMGRDPLLDPYFAAGRTGTPQSPQWRQTSGTNYCGILVVLIAVWAAIQSWRKGGLAFSITQRRYIWFWTGVVVVSLLFAWGRFSIFYALLYKLPYFSTIRSPTKFLIVLSWGIVVLFAYGIDGFSRLYLTNNGAKRVSPFVQLKNWWPGAPSFDRKWTLGCGVAVIAGFLGFLIFSGERPAFVKYLGTIGFPSSDDNPLGKLIADFSIEQAGWFAVLFAVAAGLSILIISGVLGGRRGAFGGFLLGFFLLADMSRADLPYITHWNYKQKYEIDDQHPGASTNPIINLLRDKNYDHRVAILPFGAADGNGLFEQQLYPIEWVQHQFPYYDIQTLDLFQRPRVAADIAAYEGALYFHSRDTVSRLTREWQLTNTRYLLGAAGFLDGLNSLDPLHRFRIAERFNVTAKPGITQPTKLEEITAVVDPNGSLALFEFTGALPRAKLYSNWQVNTNDEATLNTLGDPNFDPLQTVLISTPQPGLATTATNQNQGSVEFTSYAPAKIVLSVTNPIPAVLLYNGKYDADWKVTVDGRPQTVLRCNFIMRGVFLPAGAHTVVFSYRVSPTPLYVTLAAYGVAILLAGFLLTAGRTKRGDADRVAS